MTEITITTGARLHFGLFSHGQKGRREFGGVGLMIDRPGFVVRARPAEADRLNCGPWQSRVESLLAGMRASRVVPALEVEILKSPPAHVGLGSGTQLGMAVAKAASLLAGGPKHESTARMESAELARRVGRGKRSAIGLYGFQLGGLLVEAGHFGADAISPMVARVDFPEEWQILLIRPRTAAGISGAEEVGEFAKLAPMPLATTDRLCRIALTEIVPAVIERNFEAASTSIGEFGRLVGDYFAPVQGGVFADRRIRELEPLLRERKITGYGQSSWGPTMFVLCPDAASALQLMSEASDTRVGEEYDFKIAAPLNRGAAIKVI